MNLEQITKQILKLLEERGWDSPSGGSLAKSIVIESAELLEHFQWSDNSLLVSDAGKHTAIEDELADVMIYCLQLAAKLESKPADIILNKLEKVRKKYPIQDVKNNHKNYHTIKSAHRKAAT